jgi:hypothetical protein
MGHEALSGHTCNIPSFLPSAAQTRSAVAVNQVSRLMLRRHASAPNCCHLDDQPTQGLPLNCKSFTAQTRSTAGTDLQGSQQVGDGGAFGGGCSLGGLHAPLRRLCSAPG